MTEKVRAVLDAYNAIRAEKAPELRLAILQDIHMYSELYDEHRNRTEPEVFERLAKIEEQLPQKVEMIEGEELMVDDKDYDRITKDSSAPEDSRSLEYLLYARSVAAATSDKLYRAVSDIVDRFNDPKVVAVPGGVKRIRRIVFKTVTKYGCDFGKCRDMSRITVQGCNSIAVLNFGRKTEQQTAPSFGPDSVLGHYMFRLV